MSAPNPPLFIVFDGMDGTGKTTQMGLLAERLRAGGTPVVLTAEPTDAPDGQRLRQALSGAEPAGASRLAALFLLDRIGHNLDPRNGILRHLSEGRTVLCSRYYYSSIAYQGDGERFEWVARMNLDCPDIRKPDGCILLDMDPQACMARIRESRRDISLEIYETTEKQRRIRERYRRTAEYLMGRDLILSVDAAGTVEEVAERVYAAYRTIFETARRALGRPPRNE